MKYLPMEFNKNLDLIATELFEKIRSQFSNVKLLDVNGAPAHDPASARVFEFVFAKGVLSLGTVTVSISEEDGVVVLFSNSLLDSASSVAKQYWYSYLKNLREFSKQRLLNFEVRDISKSNLEKRDYKTIIKHGDPKKMSESKFHGTKKVSYQKIHETKLIVRHIKPIDPQIKGARSRQIESIFIENTAGERFKYPFKHLAGARAMAMHVSSGGIPYDMIGESIVDMSNELRQLRKFTRFTNRHNISENLKTVMQPVTERIKEIKQTLTRLQNQQFYEGYKNEYSKPEVADVPAELVEDWVDTLTIKKFNEELSDTFPFLYRLINKPTVVTMEAFADQEGVSADDIIRDIINGKIDIYNVYNDEPNSDAEKEVHDLIQRKYEEVAFDKGLYPSDDFEEILDYVFDELKDEYNSGEMIESAYYDKYMSSVDTEFNDEQYVPEDSAAYSSDDDEQASALKELNELVKQKLPVGVDGENAINSLRGLIDDDDLNEIFKELSDIDAEFDARSIIKDYIEIHDKENGTDLLSKLNFDGNDSPVGTGEVDPEIADIMGSMGNQGPAGPETTELPVTQPVTAGLVNNEKAVFEDSSGFTESDEVMEFIESMFDRETGKFPKGETGVLLSVEKKFGPNAVNRAMKAIEQVVNVTETYRIQKLAGLSEGIGNSIARKFFGHAPKTPAYSVGQQVEYEMSPPQKKRKRNC